MDRAQSGSGALADFGCHMLDLAGWLTGGSCGEVHPLAAACSTVISERQAVDGDAWLPVTNDDCAVFMFPFFQFLSCIYGGFLARKL